MGGGNKANAPTSSFCARSSKSALVERMCSDAIEPFPDSKLESFEGGDVIIIQPGSRNLYLGRGNDAFPMCVPHVVAKRIRGKNAARSAKTTSDLQELNQFAEDMVEFIHARMRENKLRPAQNALQQVVSFNAANEEPNKIADHNDPQRIEWLQPGVLPDSVFGDEALQIPLETSNFRLFFPIFNGELNMTDYSSLEELSNDMEGIWKFAIERYLKLSTNDISGVSILLILPDDVSRKSIQFYADVVTRLKTRSFAIFPTSLCAAYGAGVYTATVIDVGAQTTSIACIDDGYLVPETIIKLNMGGDLVTRLFADILMRRAHFPYELSMERYHDFSIVQSLKESCCVLNESAVTAAQVYECYIRVPHKQTLLYKFKLCEEVIIPFLSLFFPTETLIERDDVHSKFSIEKGSEAISKKLFRSNLALHRKSPSKHSSKSIQSYPSQYHPYFQPPREISGDQSTDPQEISIDEQYLPEEEELIEEPVIAVDRAVIKSIVSAFPSLVSANQMKTLDTSLEMTNQDLEKLRRYFGTIILVGGGLSCVGSARFVQDRIKSQFPSELNIEAPNINVITNPRDIDSRYLAWKGASVASRIESIVRGCWISRSEWQAYGMASLEERILFTIS